MASLVGRVVRGTVVLIAVASGVGAFTVRTLLLASLPRETGELDLAGLTAPVEVLRDRFGIPILRAGQGGGPDDLARAMGFVHAQERFFQMDLLRRDAAGELAELVGPAGLTRDERARKLRLRVVAASAVERLPARFASRLEAYAAGVNAGLADLPVRPPEYIALAIAPEPWTPQDSMLCVLTMFKELSLGARAETVIDRLSASLPPEVVDFLTPELTRFDAPLEPDPATEAYTPAPIPGPELIDLRRLPTEQPTRAQTSAEDPAPIGSNNWAVAPARTERGRAILAGDMHLALSAPNIWYRAQLEWGGHRAAGVTLPGVPALVAGSNGMVAWTFTNLSGDFEDFIAIEPDPADPGRYLTPDGPIPYGEAIEEIQVRGGRPRQLALRTTIWGVVTDAGSRGRPLVLRWTAMEPDGLDLSLLDVSECRDADEAARVVRSWRGPPQNVVIADSQGRIVWTISGLVPARIGFDGRAPVPWGGGVGWSGAIDEAHRPMRRDPTDGVLFSANNRLLPPLEARRVGHAWALGDRAGRIAEVLRGASALTERSMLELQLDTRTRIYDFYKDLALGVIPIGERDQLLAEARRIIAEWNGRADEGQSGFRLLVLFRMRLSRAVFGAITRPCRDLDKDFVYSWFQSEEPLRRILEDRPEHLLPPAADRPASWEAFLRAELSAAASQDGATAADLATRTWGWHNRSRIRHPLSLAVPLLGGLLNLPERPQAGSGLAVRVQTPSFGASQRLVVSPGHEEDGLLHMPAGQSGHFLSPHYSDGQEAWRVGQPQPLLSGPPVATLRLVPAEPAR